MPVPVPGGDAVVLAERGGSGALEAEVAGGALAGTRNPDADADGSGATVAEGGVGSCARCRARSTSAPTVSTTPAAPRIPMPAAIKRVARERGGGGVARDDGEAASSTRESAERATRAQRRAGSSHGALAAR